LIAAASALASAARINGRNGYRFSTRQRKITSNWALQWDQTWMIYV
jgi:hypothetical protein